MKISSRKQLLTLITLLIICGTVAYGQKRKESSASPSTLSEMKILPYDRMSDTFSEDISNSQDGHLNEIDQSYLVKVIVSGKAGDYSNRQVEITVREGNKLLVTRTTLVGIFNETGKYFIPVWIYGPLCQPTVIQATLLGQRQPSTIRKRLNFECGE
jgi:hypothetical protein